MESLSLESFKQECVKDCPLSPLLFSIYAESLMLKAMSDVDEGVNIGGKLLKDVRFADD